MRLNPWLVAWVAFWLAVSVLTPFAFIRWSALGGAVFGGFLMVIDSIERNRTDR